jgi:hypothetical protein
MAGRQKGVRDINLVGFSDFSPRLAGYIAIFQGGNGFLSKTSSLLIAASGLARDPLSPDLAVMITDFPETEEEILHPHEIGRLHLMNT